MTATTISFRADEQTVAELRQLAGDGNLSDAIRDLIHAQYATGSTRRQHATPNGCATTQPT